MNAFFRPRWLSIFAIAALSFAGIRLASGWLLPGAHDRLVHQYCEQIRSLPEAKAARFISRLAGKDSEWAEVIVLATCDERPVVATAAERELRNLVLRLAQQPPDQRSPQAARLARALAAMAPVMPPDCRNLLTSLAQELIAWPIDSHTIDAAQFIADCEAVLLLPLTEPMEIRVAAAPPAPELPPQNLPPLVPAPELAPSESTPPPPAVVVAPEPPPAPTPSPMPAPPPSSPNEPQRFTPGRSTRISDD